LRSSAQGETNSTTTYPAAAPIVPSTTATPIPAQSTVEDLIVEATNAQNNQEIARQRYAAKPQLQDPSKLVGTQVPGIPGAVWGYPTDGTRPTERGVDYQESQTGVPAGLEVYYRGVWYDGVTTTAQGNAVLIDYKDGYDGFLNADGSGLANWVANNPEVKVEDELIRQARRQVNAANGTAVEWRYSSQRFTNYMNALFEDRNINNITAVYTPKK
jgi:Restriction endonuclease fold toxin 5